MSSIRPVTDSARVHRVVPTVVMLAAGKGSRVLSLGNGRPKPTIPLLGLSPLPSGSSSPTRQLVFSASSWSWATDRTRSVNMSSM